ncbi:hypothetical protein [Actinoplanes sp. NPDC049599]|uniref:hypothetical protein n=1 Tax=Actinoplanes sp. NPDC049599 TaxID=3363903 RepID=UPI00378DAEC5
MKHFTSALGQAGAFALDEWGFNPASVEAVATASAVFAVIFAWLSLRESKEQRRAVEDEIGSRMRPWIGLFAFEFSESEDRKRILRIQLRNFGALPAQKARLSLVICPKVPLQEEVFDAITRQEPEYKVLMPGEEGNYPIDFSSSPELSEWIGAARDVLVKGSFEYALGDRDFKSEFEATIWFSRAPTVDTNWRNTMSS